MHYQQVMHLRNHEIFFKNETQKFNSGGFSSGGFCRGVYVRGGCPGGFRPRTFQAISAMYLESFPLKKIFFVGITELDLYWSGDDCVGSNGLNISNIWAQNKRVMSPPKNSLPAYNYTYPRETKRENEIYTHG